MGIRADLRNPTIFYQHGPIRLRRTHAVHGGRLPPAVADREERPHIQDRSRSPADLHKRTRSKLHLGIALAVARSLERATGWSVKKLLRTLSVPQHRRPNADHSLHAGTPLGDADTRRAQSS
jgi:hypothetical protein